MLVIICAKYKREILYPELYKLYSCMAERAIFSSFIAKSWLNGLDDIGKCHCTRKPSHASDHLCLIGQYSIQKYSWRSGLGMRDEGTDGVKPKKTTPNAPQQLCCARHNKTLQGYSKFPKIHPRYVPESFVWVQADLCGTKMLCIDQYHIPASRTREGTWKKQDTF